MAIDHTRPLPVPLERLDFLASMLYPDAPDYAGLSLTEQRELLALALLGEQVEAQQNTNFYLFEAYEIYNARWR